MKAKPIHEVFAKRADRIGVVLSSRILHFHGWRPGEPVNVYVNEEPGGSLVQFQRQSDLNCYIEFTNVTSAGTANTRYGDETILKAEDLGAVSTRYDNTSGFKPIELDFRDLFAKTDTKEKEASGGTSTKIAIEAEESIAGFGASRRAWRRRFTRSSPSARAPRSRTNARVRRRRSCRSANPPSSP